MSYSTSIVLFCNCVYVLMLTEQEKMVKMTFNLTGLQDILKVVFIFSSVYSLN